MQKSLDIRKNLNYNEQNHYGGKAMENHIDRFSKLNNAVVMQSGVPAYYWQSVGLTLPHPFSSK